MIEFNSLLDGLQHITTCPLCQSRITIFGDVTKVTCGDDGWTKITLEVDRNKIHVDPRTGRILSIELPNDDEEVLGGATGSPLVVSRVHWKLPTSGLFYMPVNIRCQDCNRYHLVLQIQFDVGMGERKIKKVLLNSEHLYIKESNREFEISNIYTTGVTEFVTFEEGKSGPPPRIEPCTELPLIPMDHQNVDAFIKRVKNLIIFS